MDVIQFQFSGGMSDNSEMNFYEAGRFQYGAARFIYTLEKFRQQDIVVQRLTSKVNADIRIKAPKPGSFIQEVIIFSAPLIATCAIQAPFQAIFAYAWDALLPTSKAPDVAVELAKQETEKAKLEVDKEKERTKQLEVMATLLQDKEATTQKALDVLDIAVRNGTTLATDDYRLGRNDIKMLRDDAESQVQRESVIKKYENELSAISLEKERQLVGQIRKSIKDMGMPLRSSATSLHVGDTKSSKKFAQMTPLSLVEITSEAEDDEVTVIRESIKNYDKENGYGSFRYEELKKPISFRVPANIKTEIRDDILDAMKKDDVLISGVFIRDKYENPISIILQAIHEDEEADLNP